MSTANCIAASRLWSRATQALGKLWAEVVSSPDRPRDASRRDDTYPRFPVF